MSGSFTSASATNTGGNAVITVPAGQKWKVKSAVVDVNSSATSGTRSVGIEVTVGGNVTCFVPSSYPQQPSEHPYYTFAPGVVTDSVLLDGDARVGFPEVVLGPGDTIATGIANVKSGDVVNIAINVEAFLL